MSVQPLLDRLAWLETVAPGWHESRLARIEATKDDPLLFGYLYMRAHTQLPDIGPSYSQIHLDWYRQAETWTKTGAGQRDIYIAPRGVGKSTTWFGIVPMWAAAHGHAKFIAAFADTATMAEGHLSTFKVELDRNPRLRSDFPDLCRAAKRPSGASVSDNRGMIHTESGFVFAARGLDSNALGLKVGEHRPDILLLDDVEPSASNYSDYLVEKRLATITDAILPMGAPGARTVMVGTTTMRGSIMHQAVMHDAEPATWIKDEGFTVHHALPFDENGESIWPDRWTTDYLCSIQSTPSFALNFLNSPRSLNGDYWKPTDFVIGDVPTVSRRVIAIDPAVTTARSSDQTGISVIGYSSAHKKAVVSECTGVRVKGEPLRTIVLGLLSRYPDVTEIVWEKNAGGDMLAEAVLHSMPVPVRTVWSSEKKEIRAERLLSYYRRGGILHAREFPELEGQMQEFPRGLHDDLVDSCGIGVDYLVKPKTKTGLNVEIR